MRLPFALLLSVPLVTGCVSRIETHRVTTTSPSKAVRQGQGVFYALPRTVTTLRIPVVRKTWAPGAYSDLLPYFFPCDELPKPPAPAPVPAPAPPRGTPGPTIKPDVRAEAPECGEKGGSYDKPVNEFGLDVPSLAIGTKAEPDPGQIFMIKVQGGRMEDRKLNVLLSESGVLDSLEAQVTNRTAEVVTQIAKSGVAVAGKVISGGFFSLNTNNAPGAVGPRAFTNAECPADPPLSTEELEYARFLRATDLGFFCRLDYGERETYRKMPYRIRVGFREYAFASPNIDAPKKNRFLSAFGTFSAIDSLSTMLGNNLENNGTIGTSDVPPDTQKIRIERLESQLKDKLTEFFGVIVQRVVWDAQYEVRIPEVDPANPTASSLDSLFVFAKNVGICRTSPLPPTIRPSGTSPSTAECKDDVKLHTVQVSINLTNTQPATQAALNIQNAVSSRPSEAGIFYRVPGDAAVSLVETVDEKNAILQRATLMIAQRGTVVALPPTTGGRKTAYTFSLYGASGALKNFKMESEAALDKALVSDVESAVTSAATTFAKKPKPEDPTELDKIKEERELTEEKLKLQKARNDLAKEEKAAGGTQ